MYRLYNWALKQAAGPYALWSLAFVALIEGSVFPIPPDILIVPMVLAARDKAWIIATVATVGSVCGGVLGYGIGAFLFDSIGRPVVDFYGKAESFEDFRNGYHKWGAWIVAGAGLTPFPYKVITIASGAFGLDFGIFSLSSLASRGARFFMLAALLWRFGRTIKTLVEKYLNLLATGFFLLLIGGFVVLKCLL